MLNDFKMIVLKLPDDIPHINIYPIADVHLGVAECDLKLLKLWVNTVKGDPYGYTIIAGDIMNMALKNSKSNVYGQTMSPQEQKDAAFEILKPLKQRILAGVKGNHEGREVKESGTDPLYDVFCRLQIEDLYRPNACFVKINLGEKKNKKPVSYGVVVTHGASKNKHDKWVNGVDGADVFISGHTHETDHAPKGKLRMDMHNENVYVTGYQKIVCMSFQQYGDYALSGEYLPNLADNFQKITLDGSRKHISYHYE